MHPNQAIKNHIANLTRIANSNRSSARDRKAALTQLTELEQPAAPAVADDETFELNNHYEDILNDGPYIGGQYIDLFGLPDDPKTWTPLTRYCHRRTVLNPTVMD